MADKVTEAQAQFTRLKAFVNSVKGPLTPSNPMYDEAKAKLQELQEARMTARKVAASNPGWPSENDFFDLQNKLRAAMAS